MTQAPTVRFAPSPTGYIHIGNVRTALFNWLFAKQRGGQFVLRFDDTDAERSTEAYADAIREDLEWLGLVPDRIEWQSKRQDKHDAAAEALRSRGLLYACYETPEELDRQRKRQQARRLPPIYDRSGLKLTDEDRARLEGEGRKPHWRFLLPNHDGDPFSPHRTEVHWDDVVRGPQTVDLASMSDPVLVREDGSYLYTLPSVVDDIEFGITHIIRGDDHVTNTGAQIALFRAMEADPPAFGHHNLLITIDGEGLSKRSGALSIRSIRDDGIEPMAVNSLATLVGMAGQIEAKPSLDALQEGFDPTDASKSAARFDPDELVRLNSDLVHEMPFEAVRDRLVADGVGSDDPEAFWLAVRGNCERVADAQGWWKVIEGGHATAELSDEDRQFVREAFDLLPGKIGPDTWREWTGTVKEQTGRKGKSLFMPMRLALTGLDHGPELADLLPLIGREGIEARRP